MLTLGLRFVLLQCALFASFACAEPVDWLYDVKISVNARTQKEAEIALPRSVEVLLMRLTGLSNIPMVPEVQSAFANLNTYVKQYEFTTLPINSPYGSGDALVPKFNSTMIRELIKDARFPVWPADRPSVLLWLTIHEDSDSLLVSDSEPAALMVNKRARERGIELVVPIMDLREQAKITSSSVNGRFWTDLMEASTRYSTEFIAAVSSQKDFFGRYQTAFTYWYQGTEHFDHMVLRGREDIPVKVVDHIVDVLANRHAIVREQEEIFRIGITEVASVESYAALLEQLNELDFVDDFVLVSLENDVFIFDVYTPSSADLFVELVDSTSSFDIVDSSTQLVNKKVMQMFSWVHQP